MSYKWILFDADNTLFDFDRSEHYALQKAFLDFDIPFQPDYVDTYHRVNKQSWLAFEEGQLPQELLNTRRFELFLSEISAKSNAELMGIRYLQHLADTDFLLPNALPLLNDLLETHKMALVTNGLKAVQRPRVKKSQTEHYFQSIIVSEEIGVSKPGRPFFEYTFKAIGNPVKEEVLIVGDSLNTDIQGGNDFGIHSCWYNPTGLTNESDIQPTYEIKTLQSLKSIV